MSFRLGDRSRFPKLGNGIYWNHASVSPASSLVESAVQQAVSCYAEKGLVGALELLQFRDRLRDKLATLFHTRAEQIAFTANTTASVIAVAQSFTWRSRDRVLLFSGEFPTNVTPWQSAARQFGLEVVMHPADRFRTNAAAGLHALEQELENGLRLVAVSGVQFQSGLRMPLAEMAERIHHHGALLFVDAIQGAGIVDFDVPTTGIDFLACGSHKWLMGVEGIGFLVAAPHAAAQLQPRLVGWRSHEDAFSFLTEGAGHLRYDRPLLSSLQVLESGAPNNLGFVALDAALEPLLDLTPNAIFQHVQEMHDRLEAGLVERGWESLRAESPEQRSGILALRPSSGLDLSDCCQRLNEAGVSCTMPDGVLRLSPHWPNDAAQVDRFFSIYDSVVPTP